MGTIRIYVPGGLGNQLFAYFSSLQFSLSTQSKLIVYLDDVNYTHDQREFDISSFNLLKTKINKRKFTNIKKIQSRLINGIKRRSKILKAATEYTLGYLNQGELDFFEPEIAKFDSAIKSIVNRPLFNTVNLYGYFQNCEFINKLNPELRKLQLADPSEEFTKLKHDAIVKQPIMIHIRLANYLQSPNFEKLGVLHPDYYQLALDYVLMKFPGREIWIFSHSAGNAKTLYPKIALFNTQVRYIEPKPNFDDPAESLILLTLGCAIICSNSTFSLISTLINPNNRTVVVPKKLYRQSGTKQLNYLKNWHLIENSWLQSKPNL